MKRTEIRVLPGYQRLNWQQRDALLSLAEDDELTNPVRVLELGPPALIVDRHNRRWRIHTNGKTEEQPTP